MGVLLPSLSWLLKLPIASQWGVGLQGVIVYGSFFSLMVISAVVNALCQHHNLQCRQITDYREELR